MNILWKNEGKLIPPSASHRLTAAQRTCHMQVAQRNAFQKTDKYTSLANKTLAKTGREQMEIFPREFKADRSILQRGQTLFNVAAPVAQVGAWGSEAL